MMVPWWGWAIIAFASLWTLVLLILIGVLIVVMLKED